MKILVLNGSPRGEKSNTMKMTEAFLRGVAATGAHEIEIAPLCRREIKPCLGCFRCWTDSPGVCVHKDDMPDLLEKYREADRVIWSAPLYYFGLPSMAKAFMDRLLPLNLPQLVEEGEDGHCSHPPRYDLSHQRYLLLSNCGFYNTAGNYDALCKQFEILYGDRVQWVLRSQGELLAQPALTAATGPFFRRMEEAGREWAEGGVISAVTLKTLEEPFYPTAQFLEMANAQWDITTARQAAARGETADVDEAYALVRQMAAVCRPEALEGSSAVLEMYFTDSDRRYQLQVSPEGCQAVKEESSFLPYSTRIETPLPVWREISDGAVSGPTAMMEQKYRTLGDFDLMLKMEKLFPSGDGAAPSGGNPTAADSGQDRPSWMMMLFLPSIPIWSLSFLGTQITSPLTIAICALLPYIARLLGKKLTPFDVASASLFTLLAAAQFMGLSAPMASGLSYLCFALIWLFSLRGPLPITAYYSAHQYGGESMFVNPLFVKTNAILTACWAGVYGLQAALIFLFARSPHAPLANLFVIPLVVAMLIFTAWFQRWYPAKVARG